MSTVFTSFLPLFLPLQLLLPPTVKFMIFSFLLLHLELLICYVFGPDPLELYNLTGASLEKTEYPSFRSLFVLLDLNAVIKPLDISSIYFVISTGVVIVLVLFR